MAAMINDLSDLDRLRKGLPGALEFANHEYWNDPPPGGWGSYGIWDHLTDAIINFLLTADERASAPDIELWTIHQVAAHLGRRLSTARSVLRKARDDWHMPLTRYGAENSSRYDATEIEAIKAEYDRRARIRREGYAWH